MFVPRQEISLGLVGGLLSQIARHAKLTAEMMRLTFLGTKGEIDEETALHRFHSSLLLEYGGVKLLIDYGLLRRYSLQELAPQAILITHAHPDHYAWLKEDVPCDIPLYLTQATLDYGRFKPHNARVVAPLQAFKVGEIECLAYSVMHSIRCPAVGWKISAGGKTLVYNSDLVDIIEKDTLLAGVDAYIGDGSAVQANLVRRQRDVLFGHTRIMTQARWCEKHGISRIIFTHLGKETLREEAAFKAGHPEIILAYDGLELQI